MKTTLSKENTEAFPSHPGLLEPFFTFDCPNLGYSILIIPHSPQARAKLMRKAKKSDLSLAEFAKDEIVGTLVMSAKGD